MFFWSARSLRFFRAFRDFGRLEKTKFSALRAAYGAGDTTIVKYRINNKKYKNSISVHVSCLLSRWWRYNFNCDGSPRVEFHTALYAPNTAIGTEYLNFKRQLVYNSARIVPFDEQSSQRDTRSGAALGELSSRDTIIRWLICSYILYDPEPDTNIIDLTTLFNTNSYLSGALS